LLFSYIFNLRLYIYTLANQGYAEH